MSNRITLFYMDVITNTCPNPDAVLADLCYYKKPIENICIQYDFKIYGI